MEDRGYLALALFDALQAAEVEYCVLGDVYRFPHEIPSDIDIAVDPRTLHRVPGVLASFCREYDLQIVQWLQHEHSAWYFVLSWRDDVGRPRYVALDFCGDWRRDGRVFLHSRELLGRRREALDAGDLPKGFDVPAPDVQFIYYLLKKVDKLELDAGQGECLARMWSEDSAPARRQIVRFWPDPADASRLAYAAESNIWDGVRVQLPGLRKSMRRNLPHQPGSCLREGRRILARLLHPSGVVVAVMGPDGSGKSTVLRLVEDGVAPAFRRTCTLHLRPRLLPWPKASANARPDRPHALPVRGRVASLLKLAWFVADGLLGHLLRVWPFTLRSGLVLFDRDLRDMLVDPKRYRMNLPAPLIRLALRMIPVPDLWILLDTPAEILQSRKGEVSLLESGRQRRAFLDLVSGLRDAVVIDASRPPEVVAAEVEAAILRALEFRLERRHPRWFVGSNPLAAKVLLFVCRHRLPGIGRLVRLLLNSDVYCRIRAPILMPHPYGIVIHSKAVIGSRVTIMQQVTIGGKDPLVEAAPVIEDNVYIGAGAKVLGGVRIGRGAVVGANAVVTRDVLSHCKVVGANRVLQSRRTGGPEPSEDGKPGASSRECAQPAWNGTA